MFRLATGVVLAGVILAGVVLAGCRREAAPVSGVAASPVPAPVQASVPLEDVMQRDPRYLVGISYPPVARSDPGLGRLLKTYADAARSEMMQAVRGLGDQKPTAPYDLSLGFSEVVVTPGIVAVAANGSSYTGGAHGNPLVARFVWLPREQRQLTAAQLVPDSEGWQAIARYVRERLVTAMTERVDADGPTPAERADFLSNGARMIDDGTAPDPANFDQFEPVLDAAGRITALRFVFPPYQVGPYADGVQSVEVPAAVLLPVVAPDYRALFQGG